jgi:hypothetical protein
MNDFDSQDDKAYTDQLFARLSSIEPSAKLSRTVAQIPIEYPRSVLSFLPFKSAWQPVFALAAAAAVGFFAGQSVLNLRTENAPAQLAALDEAADEVANADAIDEELEGLLLLASAGDFESDDWGDSLESSATDTQSEEGTF